MKQATVNLLKDGSTGGQPVVTSTLALIAKVGAVLRDERVALLAEG